jgi:hypothetical protein
MGRAHPGKILRCGLLAGNKLESIIIFHGLPLCIWKKGSDTIPLMVGHSFKPFHIVSMLLHHLKRKNIYKICYFSSHLPYYLPIAQRIFFLDNNNSKKEYLGDTVLGYFWLVTRGSNHM